VIIYTKGSKTIMLNRLKSIFIPFFTILMTFLLLVGLFLKTKYITFSDAAKFADVARNLVNGLGYVSSFSFSGSLASGQLAHFFSTMSLILPVMPLSIAGFFKVFGIGDFAVIATSFFYFLLTLIFVFLLAKRIYKNNLVGILSTLAVGFNYDLIHYAVSGASESPFIFEIVAATYFVGLKKKCATILAFVLLVLMYFTRRQAFIYIAGLVLYYFLSRFKTKKAILYFLGVSIAALLFDRYVLLHFVGKYFLYSVIGNGLNVGSQYLPGSAVSDALRGDSSLGVPIVSIGKKVFYNLYNFYKLLPQIMSPYLFALFAIGLFIKSKFRSESTFKIASIFMVVVTLLVTAASIPFYRYLHPVVPLIYVVAVGTLFEILNLVFTKQKLIIPVSLFLILLFGAGQTLGVLILDSRFEANTHNVGKPPIYVVLSQVLKANTNPSQVIITNLDTWGSWYGERKTVWFPLEPKQLIDPTTGKIPFNAIYLTSYLIDDQNYYMGNSWRGIFNNPNDSKEWICDGCQEIAKEFKLKGIYKVNAGEDYERQDASSMLLIKK